MFPFNSKNIWRVHNFLNNTEVRVKKISIMDELKWSLFSVVSLNHEFCFGFKNPKNPKTIPENLFKHLRDLPKDSSSGTVESTELKRYLLDFVSGEASSVLDPHIKRWQMDFFEPIYTIQLECNWKMQRWIWEAKWGNRLSFCIRVKVVYT